MFNSFLCTFLNIFQASFPVIYRSMKDKNNWITWGIKISCKHKRSLYTFSKNNNDWKQKHFILNIVKSKKKGIKDAKKHATVDL